MRSLDELARENISKYLHPPDGAMIRAYIKKRNTTDAHFERFFGMSRGTVDRSVAGRRRMPPQYWHFFYEDIVPAYGAGFLEVQRGKAKTDLRFPPRSHNSTAISGKKDTLSLKNNVKTGKSTAETESERINRLLNSK